MIHPAIAVQVAQPEWKAGKINVEPDRLRNWAWPFLVIEIETHHITSRARVTHGRDERSRVPTRISAVGDLLVERFVIKRPHLVLAAAARGVRDEANLDGIALRGARAAGC